jgi:glutaredoxin
MTAPDAGGRPATVTVYTRACCTLCREAERVVAEVAHGRAEVQLVDIDADPSITERYTVRVPVVAIDGEELFEYEVDAEALRRALRG